MTTRTKKYQLRFTNASGETSLFKVKFRTKKGAVRWAENTLQHSVPGITYEVVEA